MPGSITEEDVACIINALMMAERDGEEEDAEVHLPDVGLRLHPELFVTVRELLREIAECVVSPSSA
jgi:hypothetical protein